MEDFIYENPTKIVFGKGSVGQTGKTLKHYCKRVLLHTGTGSIKKHGTYDRVVQSLREEGIGFIELCGVRPNPVLSMVHEGIRLCRAEKIGFILAVGGGSVIDSAKAIAIGTPYAGDVWDFFAAKASPKEALGIGSVLTIPGAGSESSDAIVITKEDGLIKRGYHHDLVRPRFAILDPELSMTLSPFQTACGISDMMSHVMERYFTMSRDNDLTDRLCEAALKTMIKNGPAVLHAPEDYSARAEIMWAGAVAHNGILGTGRDEDWGSHKIAHEISAIYDMAHGATLSIVFPAWLRHAYPKNIPLVAQFAERVFSVETDFFDLERTALAGIERLKSFYRSLDLPVSFSDAGIGSDRFEEMAQKCTVTGPKGNLFKMQKEDVLTILQEAL